MSSRFSINAQPRAVYFTRKTVRKNFCFHLLSCPFQKQTFIKPDAAHIFKMNLKNTKTLLLKTETIEFVFYLTRTLSVVD